MIQPQSKSLDSTGQVNEYDEILLTPDETSEALREARERKFYRLQEFEREARAAEVRRQLTEQWSANQTRDFMHWRAKRLDTKWEFNDFAKPEGGLVCNAKTIFELFCLYFSNDPGFVVEASRLGVYKPDLRKGLLLAGRIGCGKSSLMRLFGVNQRQVYMIKTANEVAEKWLLNGEDYFAGLIKPHMLPVNDVDNFYHRFAGLCIDDVGTEEIKTSFGNRKNVIGDLIEARYHEHAAGPLLHLTTNLNWETLKEHYGARVASRLQETMNMIQYKGEDRRK